MTTFHIVIPARYQSTRLPGKLLMDLGGKSVLERVFIQAKKAKPVSIIIATDHDEIAEHASMFGAKVVRTSVNHQSGTDRIAEAIEHLQLENNTIVVNVQGDEPFIPPILINQVADLLASDVNAVMATLCSPIHTFEEANNPNVVKVVFDQHKHALYFSRSMIPFHQKKPTEPEGVFRHIGIYAYRAEFLKKFTSVEPSLLEKLESLEQLRVLSAGDLIAIELAKENATQDINTAEDLLKARSFFL